MSQNIAVIDFLTKCRIDFAPFSCITISNVMASIFLAISIVLMVYILFIPKELEA